MVALCKLTCLNVKRKLDKVDRELYSLGKGEELIQFGTIERIQ